MPNIDGVQSIKVYFRLTSKYAKIVYLPSSTSTDQLYLFASQNYSVPIEQIHLFYQGQLLPTSTTITLQDNAIIHIVRLNSLKKEMINVSIQMIGTTKNIKLTIAGTTVIKELMEDRICSYFGVKLHEILLVYLGRQLKLQHSFQQQQVQDGSQILCLLLQGNPQEPIIQKIERSDSYKIKIPIQRLQTPQPPKDIYPKSDFAINVPQGIHTSNNLNLIFDSKVKRSSSIQNVELLPQEIIAEQESNFQADFVKCSQSQNSKGDENKHKQSFLSQEWITRSPKCSEIQKSTLEQPKMLDFKSNDVIYAANFHMLRDSKIMGDLISEYKDKLKVKIDKAQHLH